MLVQLHFQPPEVVCALSPAYALLASMHCLPGSVALATASDCRVPTACCIQASFPALRQHWFRLECSLAPGSQYSGIAHVLDFC